MKINKIEGSRTLLDPAVANEVVDLLNQIAATESTDTVFIQKTDAGWRITARDIRAVHPRSDWKKGHTYALHDLVFKNGVAYIAINLNTNKDPEGTNGTKFWRPLIGSAMSARWA